MVSETAGLLQTQRQAARQTTCSISCVKQMRVLAQIRLFWPFAVLVLF